MPVRKRFRSLLVTATTLMGLTAPGLAAAGATDGQPPNIVIIFTDDQGFGDVGCFGATNLRTPNLDRMAAEGRRFTSFYVAQAVCGASRAALLTGCYPNRLGMLGAPGPATKHGVHERETLLSELVKQQDYATAAFGKWHLGHHPQFLPLQHGFDEYYGLPYSNDMWPFHPEVGKQFPDLPLIEGNQIVNPAVTSADQTRLTTDYTQRAVSFIERSSQRPFLLYLAHSMPHVPLHVSAERAGAGGYGLYSDVIAEIDWSVGEVLAALARTGVDDHTLVVFTTDNGPWLSYGNHAGSAGPLREGKGTTWEGGVRVPCIMRWPGHIPAGTECREPAATIDIFPTIARLIGAELPSLPIDGRDIWPLMSGVEGATSPHDALYFYWGNELQAIRSGRWKLHFPHEYRTLAGPGGQDGLPTVYTQQKTGLALYDLETDIGETTDVQSEEPEVVARLMALADAVRIELGDSARDIVGQSCRQPARIE